MVASPFASPLGLRFFLLEYCEADWREHWLKAFRKSEKVMFRIDVLEETESSVTLKVSGWIVSDDVSIFEQECQAHIDKGQELLLDFFDVRSVDREGLAVLERLVAGGVQVMNCPRYIELHLEAQRKGRK